ncbi:MAG: competence protein CoiA family protein [Carnobacterium sp.]
MLIALNEKNQPVHANIINEEKQIKKIYCCPSCKENVFLKKGVLKVAHFSHFKKTNCFLFSEGETKEHLEGKQLLYEWFIKQGLACQLEAYLPDLNQRPDILVWVSQTKAIAIEFQCSSLSFKKMKERTAGYKKKGYDVFWIVGSKFKLDDRISAFQRLFIYSNTQVTSSLFFLDVVKKTVHLYSNIQQENITQKITCDNYVILLDHFKLSDLPILLTKLAAKVKGKTCKVFGQPKELLKSHSYLNHGRMYQIPELVSFQKYIYQRGDSLISLPKEIYFIVPGQIMIKTLPHFWKYILLKWITENKIDSIVTLKELDNQINEMINNKMVLFYPMPLLMLEEQKKPFYYYIQLLIKSAILEEIQPNHWILKKKPYYYKSEQEKITSFSNGLSLIN